MYQSQFRLYKLLFHAMNNHYATYLGTFFLGNTSPNVYTLTLVLLCLGQNGLPEKQANFHTACLLSYSEVTNCMANFVLCSYFEIEAITSFKAFTFFKHTERRVSAFVIIG